MRMPFGKHRGKDLEDVPDSYLLWCLANLEALNPLLRRAIEEHLEVPPPPPPRAPAPPAALEARRIADAIRTEIRDVYRATALKHHPDRGGNTAAMAAVNDFYARLDEALTGWSRGRDRPRS